VSGRTDPSAGNATLSSRYPVRLIRVPGLHPQPESPSDLPDDTTVVRGGLMHRERTIKSAEAAFREFGVYGLSVWAVANLNAEKIVRHARHHDTESQHYLPHPQMRTSTVGQLRRRGFDLEPDSPRGHYLLTIPTPPTDDDWDALEQEFGEPQPTPPR
jgi:hypothetical protein